jgi:PAS domain S-box-containing protein
MEKVKTLIVEDEIFVAKDLQMHLEQMGYAVASMVPSGEQAIQEIENEIPDLVLMDIVLQEGMDGIEAAEIIHSRFDIPVIFLTAHKDKAIFERAKKTEPFGYITKPFQGEDLRKAIEVALFRHKAEQERKALVQKQMMELSESLEKQIIKYTHIEEKYHKLIETAKDAIFIADVKTGIILYANKRAEELMDMPAEKIVGMHRRQLHPEGEAEKYKKLFSDHIRRGVEISEEVFVCRKDGHSVPVEISASVIEWEGIKVIQGIFRDITERVKSKEMLQEQKESLEQKNIALSEILRQIEVEKQQIEDNVIANAENLLLPTIQKLGLTEESRQHAQLLRQNLQELTSSFGTRLADKKAKLTSREIEICNMIKNGLTSKEMAGLLNTAILTVEKHRSNIRNKLGIANKKISLPSTLREL